MSLPPPITTRQSTQAFAGGLAVDPNNVQCDDGLAEVKAAKAKREKLAADRAAADLEHMSMDPTDRYVIGIDLGTTYSCVSVWKDGEAQVLANSEGETDDSDDCFPYDPVCASNAIP